MLIYTSQITPRLQYSLDFLGKEIIGEAFKITTDKDFYLANQSVKINYGPEILSPDEFWIKPHSLLFETGIKEQFIKVEETGEQKYFFKTEGDFPFDIFAASFYLLSRYEEYLPHQKDMYGRYAHENALAFRQGFLDKPLVNVWIAHFRKALEKRFTSFTTHHSAFTFLPTYDIDIAWSYRHKGWQRNVGGLLQSIMKGKWQQVKQRIAVLRNQERDPFDSYEWLNRLHAENELTPCYFFLLAERNGLYDKNILPGKKAFQSLIAKHSALYNIGIHPSWRSGDEKELLKKEIDNLSRITGKKINKSRQHYIRFDLPTTFRLLIESGIQQDYSMGYGSINGFRASVASPFYWYDLEREQSTPLVLFPFCYMEANSFYEQKYSAQQALEEMRGYYDSVKSVDGTFIMIWHNHFLGTDPLFKGWREIYKEIVEIAREANSKH